MIRNPLESFLSEVNRGLISPFEYFQYAPIEAFDHYKDLDNYLFNTMFPLWIAFHRQGYLYQKVCQTFESAQRYQNHIFSYSKQVQGSYFVNSALGAS